MNSRAPRSKAEIGKVVGANAAPTMTARATTYFIGGLWLVAAIISMVK